MFCQCGKDTEDDWDSQGMFPREGGSLTENFKKLLGIKKIEHEQGSTCLLS